VLIVNTLWQRLKLEAGPAGWRLRGKRGQRAAVRQRCAEGHEVTKMVHALARYWWDEQGLTSVEYALLLALVVVSAAATWHNFGQCLKHAADEPIRVMQASSSG